MKKPKRYKEGKYKTTCDCACRSHLVVQTDVDGIVMIDIRNNKKDEWRGIVLYPKKVNKLIKLLNDRTN